MTLKPNIILSLPVDPVSVTNVYEPAVKAGTKIVFADNCVKGYKHGQQYVAVCTGDQYGMGRAAADLMSKAIGGKGKIGVIYYDVDFLITNNRDNEFIKTIHDKYPNITISSMMGFSEESKTGDVPAAMLTQNKDLDGIYVSWDVAAEPVVAQLRSNNMQNVKMVTYDLGGTNDLDMAQGGIVYGKIADMPFQIGATMAKEAALSILGQSTATYAISDVVEMKKDNMIDAWRPKLKGNLISTVT